MDSEYSLSDLSLTPINFFAFEFDCYQAKGFDGLPAKHLLPDLTALHGDETSLADVSLGWNKEGIVVQVRVNNSYGEDDGIELFIDTRDLKSAGFNTRFCHHFLFKPEGGRELTHFRTEDSHEHCNPGLLVVKKEIKKNYYILKIFIPSQCLYGYDPDQFTRLGFTYRINTGGASQHFSVSSYDYQIDQNPSLWSSLILIP